MEMASEFSEKCVDLSSEDSSLHVLAMSSRQEQRAMTDNLQHAGSHGEISTRFCLSKVWALIPSQRYEKSEGATVTRRPLHC